MRRPRCQVKLPRVDMVTHLWQEHRLMLDGQRVREPWRIVEERVVDYAVNKDPAVLAQCLEMGQQLDPEQGANRVRGLLLARGINDGEARESLLTEAAGTRRRCARPASRWCRSRRRRRSGRWTSRTVGCRCAATRSRCRKRPDAAAGDHHADGGRLPRRRARPGVTPDAPGVPGRPVGAGRAGTGGRAAAVEHPVGGAGADPAGVGGGGGCGHPGPVGPAEALADRAVNHAWSRLVPRLHAGGFSADDSAFIAGLALTSLSHGRAEPRQAALELVVPLTENAVAAGVAPAGHLAILWRLLADDANRAGRDLVPLVARQVERRFKGDSPLAFARQLLSGWEAEWWTEGTSPGWRCCRRSGPSRLASRSATWCSRAAWAPAWNAPWGPATPTCWPSGFTCGRSACSALERRGQAATAFELAAWPTLGAEYLSEFPDLLLYDAVAEDADKPAAVILMRARGVAFQKTLFGEPPWLVEVLPRGRGGRRTFEVVLDRHRFWFAKDPAPVIHRLERWFDYCFHDFRPRVAVVHEWNARGGDSFRRPASGSSARRANRRCWLWKGRLASWRSRLPFRGGFHPS